MDDKKISDQKIEAALEGLQSCVSELEAIQHVEDTFDERLKAIEERINALSSAQKSLKTELDRIEGYINDLEDQMKRIDQFSNEYSDMMKNSLAIFQQVSNTQAKIEELAKPKEKKKKPIEKTGPMPKSQMAKRNK